MNYGLLAVWIFPILAGVVGFLLGKKNKDTRNDWIDIAMFLEIVILACMGYELYKGWDIAFSLDSGKFGFGIFLQMDVIRLLLCSMMTVVFAILSIFMKESLRTEKSSNRFYGLFMVAFGFVQGAVLSTNILSMVIFAALAFLCIYPLLVHRPEPLAKKNARIYGAFSVVSVILIVAGFCVLIQNFDLTILMYSYGDMSLLWNRYVILGGFLMLGGFGMWTGLFPLQFQITRGSSYGLIESSAILNLTVSKIGFLGIFMEGVGLFLGSLLFGRTVIFVGLATCIWGLILTLTSTDIRKILMGLNVAVNGIIAMSAGIMVTGGKDNAYAIRSSFYLFVVSSVSMLVFYMAALEMVRKVNTYEIKGLIASGKGNTLLKVACFLSGASLIGVPGTAGFLAQSMMLKSIFHVLGWRWLLVAYIILWAFLITAVVRIIMKIFISDKDKTIHILTPEEEEQTQEEGTQEEEKNSYRFGEVLLLLTGIFQVVIGILPRFTIDRLSKQIDGYFAGSSTEMAMEYYSGEVLALFIVVALIALLLYLNLVHGILLRAIRNKKNKKLQENQAKDPD